MVKMNRARILIADDEKAICRYISQQLEIELTVEADVDFAHNRDRAIQLLDTGAPYDSISGCRMRRECWIRRRD